MSTEHEPSCDVLANKNAACGSPATVTSLGSSISIHTLAPPLYSPAALYRASPDSMSVSSALNTSMFCTILYLLPTTPMADSPVSSCLSTACFLGTCIIPSLCAHKSVSDTVQSKPACRAASTAEVASTAVPPRFQALRLLSTSAVVITLLYQLA